MTTIKRTRNADKSEHWRYGTHRIRDLLTSLELVLDERRPYNSHCTHTSRYIFGDEFTGDSVDEVVEILDRINKIEAVDST